RPRSTWPWTRWRRCSPPGDRGTGPGSGPRAATGRPRERRRPAWHTGGNKTPTTVDTMPMGRSPASLGRPGTPSYHPRASVQTRAGPLPVVVTVRVSSPLHWYVPVRSNGCRSRALPVCEFTPPEPSLTFTLFTSVVAIGAVSFTVTLSWLTSADPVGLHAPDLPLALPPVGLGVPVVSGDAVGVPVAVD